MRIVVCGAGVALATGLMLGGALQPNLADDDRPVGPQTVVGDAAARSVGPMDSGPALASYAGAVPDYVLGTDWKRTMTSPDVAAVAPTPEAPLAATEAPPSPVVRTRAAVEDLPAPAHGRYPSNGGDLPVRAPVGQAVDAADNAPAVAS